ncbi:MAG: DNA polymerase subunit beta [Candidatus Lokiarchaeota archaeon]|nr:DNA polymerase subunit beta [Candidatus Lokiarchaeota archaeon]MBD3200010.1 DNA polymerase subunit beta [Candidatus Lokiarchaeota archaeon]
MSTEKILRDHRQVVKYSTSQWSLLEDKRKSTMELLEIFEKKQLFPYVYGSIARGNVHPNSDIDLIFLYRIPAYKIEFILNQNGYHHYRREIIMATPNDSIKLYLYLSELKTITIPLTRLDNLSQQFYDFGGKIDIKQLRKNIRVPGIDKRLVLIKPIKEGHKEYSIINRNSIAAKEVGVSIEMIKQRERVLLRREKFGRTGVFLKRELSYSDTPEGLLKKISNHNSIVRKKLYKK